MIKITKINLLNRSEITFNTYLLNNVELFVMNEPKAK